MHKILLYRWQQQRAKLRKYQGRLEKAMSEGHFQKMLSHQKAALLSRIEKLKQQILRLESVLKMGVAATIVAASFSGTEAQAQMTTQGSEFLVSTFTTNNQYNSQTAMDQDGNYVVTWQSNNQAGATSTYDVYAQRYNAAGVAQGTEFLVNTYTTNGQLRPSVAMDANGNFVVTWQSQNQASGTSDFDIYGQRYNALGVAQGTEFLVNTFTANSQGVSNVAMDVSGNFIVTWESYNHAGATSKYDIYAQRYNVSGVAQGSEFLVNTFTTLEQTLPSVSIDATGNFVVVWSSQNQASGTSGYDVYGQRYNTLGVAQGTEFLVNTFTTNSQVSSTVAVDTNGNFVVAWESQNQAGASSGYDIYAQRYNAAGVAQGAEFLVNTFTTSSQYTNRNCVAMDASGNFVVIWESKNQAGASSSYDVYAQRYNASGVAQESELLVNTYTINAQSFPAVAMSDYGDVLMTWSSQNQTSGTSGYDIYAQRYKIAGFPSPTAVLESTATAGIAMYPNPTKGLIQISAAQELDNANISIINSSGNVVFENRQTILQGNNTLENVNHLTSGIYMVIITSDSGKRSQKLVVE